MVGLSDIPCGGEVVNRISKFIVDAMIRHLRYMLCYKSLVNQLNSEIEKLNIEKEKMSEKVEEEKNNGKIIHDSVLPWQDDVDEIHTSPEELSPSCSCIPRLPIPNPISRYRLGKNAANKAKKVTVLTISGRDLITGGIAKLPPVDDVPGPVGEFQRFKSREYAYQKLWEVLVTEDSARILGIYGMAGVGKTRMMEQIWEEAKKKSKFDMVVRIVVGSEKFDVIKVQEQFADILGCNFVSQDHVRRRASQLKISLVNRGNILIILDDVWEKIDLDSIGIPFDDGSSSNTCKILLTSRSKDVCLQNHCKYHVGITPLTSNEAWDLFSSTVGTGKIHSLLDETLAKEVCEKCSGLPLVIYAVGNALKLKQHCSWEDALDQLKNCEIKKVPGITEVVYACLKLSFDYLEEDAKRCLLLCSLCPEDAIINIKELFQLATGSQLVSGKETRVRAMVAILKSSLSLLEPRLSDFKNKLRSIVVRRPEIITPAIFDNILKSTETHLLMRRAC